jgi:DMSO reductase anchor subunit
MGNFVVLFVIFFCQISEQCRIQKWYSKSTVEMVYQMSSMIGMVLGNKFQRWQEFRFQDGIAGNVIFIFLKS